jgi:alkanesulfonate monooxygenase SsuD/methylene tetrahydromethanopterin reductase-like flavin-dependent oxidoreductase (luciferase family)
VWTPSVAAVSTRLPAYSGVSCTSSLQASKHSCARSIPNTSASEPGRQLAAETAEAVFTAQSSLAAGREFYADVKSRAKKVGRSRDHLKILLGCFVVVGDTVEEARAKRSKLDSLVHYGREKSNMRISI